MAGSVSAWVIEIASPDVSGIPSGRVIFITS
jgi:hypothetical protein